MVDEKLVKNDRILEEMVRRLATAFHPDHIYLYDSRVYFHHGSCHTSEVRYSVLQSKALLAMPPHKHRYALRILLRSW
jgi:hypothetical protein